MILALAEDYTGFLQGGSCGSISSEYQKALLSPHRHYCGHFIPYVQLSYSFKTVSVQLLHSILPDSLSVSQSWLHSVRVTFVLPYSSSAVHHVTLEAALCLLTKTPLGKNSSWKRGRQWWMLAFPFLLQTWNKQQMINHKRILIGSNLYGGYFSKVSKRAVSPSSGCIEKLSLKKILERNPHWIFLFTTSCILTPHP